MNNDDMLVEVDRSEENEAIKVVAQYAMDEIVSIAITEIKELCGYESHVDEAYTSGFNAGLDHACKVMVAKLSGMC